MAVRGYHGPVLRHAGRTRRWVTVASGITGVVVAHLVAYVLAYSDAHQRAHVLHDTGHGYFAFAAWLGAAVAAASMAAVAAKAAGRTASGRGVSVVPGFSALALWQGLLFLAVETTERVVAGASLLEMVHGHEVLIGLAVQVVVAAAIVVLLRGTERLSARIANALQHPLVAEDRGARLRPSDWRPWRLRLAAASRSRAPPGRVTTQLS